MEGYTPGRFVWFDLMSTDPEATRRFYTELFGWTVSAREMGPMGTYQMISAGERGLGGIVPLDPSHGLPSHWMGYLSVADVAGACESVRAAGGTVHVEQTGIAGVGSFAVVQDPSGALFSPFTPGEGPSTEGPPVPGTVCWSELLTNDPEGMRAFYTALCGWTERPMDMGPMGTYTVFLRGGVEAGGMMKMPPEAGGAPSHWLHYVMVEDVDAAAERIGELGGKVCVEPRDIPGIGRFAVAFDPAGAVFAVYAAGRA